MKYFNLFIVLCCCVLSLNAQSTPTKVFYQTIHSEDITELYINFGPGYKILVEQDYSSGLILLQSTVTLENGSMVVLDHYTREKRYEYTVQQQGTSLTISAPELKGNQKTMDSETQVAFKETVEVKLYLPKHIRMANFTPATINTIDRDNENK